jgi:hypothetical protein
VLLSICLQDPAFGKWCIQSECCRRRRCCPAHIFNVARYQGQQLNMRVGEAGRAEVKTCGRKVRRYRRTRQGCVIGPQNSWVSRGCSQCMYCRVLLPHDNQLSMCCTTRNVSTENPKAPVCMRGSAAAHIPVWQTAMQSEAR